MNFPSKSVRPLHRRAWLFQNLGYIDQSSLYCSVHIKHKERFTVPIVFLVPISSLRTKSGPFPEMDYITRLLSNPPENVHSAVRPAADSLLIPELTLA